MTKNKFNVDMKRIQTDLIYFIEHVINLSEPKLKLTEFHKEWLNLITQKKRMSIMAFRSSGKSELFFICYPIWRAFTQRSFQGILVSNSERQSIRLLRRIKQRIESNPILSTSIPRSRTDSWSKTELTLSNGSWIGSKPYNENLRGDHVDFVGADEMGEYRDFQILTDTILPMLRAKKGNFFGVGTPKSELDLLHTIEAEERFKAFYTDRYPAQGEEKGDLFHQRYPETRIIEKGGIVELWTKDDEGKEYLEDAYDSISWSQEFLLKPLGQDDQLFPFKVISYAFDKEKCFSMKRSNQKKYYMGVDFAISGSASADFTVITIVERAPDTEELRVVAIDRSKGLSYEAQLTKIVSYAETFRPLKIVCDDGNVGKIFIQDLRQMHMPVEGYHFGGNRSVMSQNKRELFMAMRQMFDKKLLFINASDKDLRTRTLVNRLIDELTKFCVSTDAVTKTTKFEGKGKHDDMVDSLAMAVYGARQFGKGSFSIRRGSTGKRRSGLIKVS